MEYCNLHGILKLTCDCAGGLETREMADHLQVGSCQDKEENEELLRQSIAIAGESAEEDDDEELLKQAIALSLKD